MLSLEVRAIAALRSRCSRAGRTVRRASSSWEPTRLACPLRKRSRERLLGRLHRDAERGQREEDHAIAEVAELLHGRAAGSCRTRSCWPAAGRAPPWRSARTRRPFRAPRGRSRRRRRRGRASRGATASSKPVTPRASVRAMMTKSRIAARGARRRGSSRPSPRARPATCRRDGRSASAAPGLRGESRRRRRASNSLHGALDVERLAEAGVGVAEQRQASSLGR